MKKLKIIAFVSRLDAHHRLIIAVSIAVITSLVLPQNLLLQTKVVVCWVVFACSVLVLAWTAFLFIHPRQTPHLSRIQDSSRTLIFVLVLGSAVGSVGAVLALLTEVKKLVPDEISRHLFLALMAVFFSWLLVHTLFTLRYAHLYYNQEAKGLDFPATTEPDYLDFAYFSLVVGMTSQVSDVQITSSPMRRLALLHGLLSFLFNTVIVALTINIMAGLL